MTDKSRDAFERTAAELRADFTLDKDSDGDYISFNANQAYLIWQASQAHTLAFLKSDRAVILVARAFRYLEDYDEDEWSHEKHVAESAIAALIKDIQG